MDFIFIIHTFSGVAEVKVRTGAVSISSPRQASVYFQMRAPYPRPRPLPGPRVPREKLPPREGPRPRPPPLWGGGPRGSGGFRERWPFPFPDNGGRPREGPRDLGSPRLFPTPFANLIFPRVLPRGAGTGRPLPRETRDIMSSSSGEEGGDQSRLPRAPGRPRPDGGPFRLAPTELRFVIMSGSMPFRLNEDDDKVTLLRVPPD